MLDVTTSVWYTTDSKSVERIYYMKTFIYTSTSITIAVIFIVVSFNLAYTVKFHSQCERITWGDHYATFNCNY